MGVSQVPVGKEVKGLAQRHRKRRVGDEVEKQRRGKPRLASTAVV